MTYNIQYHFNNGEPLPPQDHLEQAKEEGYSIKKFDYNLSPKQDQYFSLYRKDEYGHLRKFPYKEDKVCIQFPNGIIAFYKLNKFERFELHRKEGPAFIHFGMFWWMIENKFHREDGPAYLDAVWRHPEFEMPGKFHYFEVWNRQDSWHREDGPAIIDVNGYHFYENHKYIKMEHYVYPPKP